MVYEGLNLKRVNTNLKTLANHRAR